VGNSWVSIETPKKKGKSPAFRSDLAFVGSNYASWLNFSGLASVFSSSLLGLPSETHTERGIPRNKADVELPGYGASLHHTNVRTF
jgi:hypothetical protein